MLCEGRLLSMSYFPMVEEHDRPALQTSSKCAHGPPEPTPTPAPTRLPPPVTQSSLVQAGVPDSTASLELHISPLQSLDLQGILTGRQISPKIEIPAQVCSSGDGPFLVPSSCQSICQNYSDLHIGGDQVLPLSTNQGELRVCPEAQAVRPFLQSCDVPPDEEDSLLGQAFQAGQPHLLRKGSNLWRQGSSRDWSVLFQGREGPFSNSLLNHYLEQKILDLYQQCIMENVERQGTLASEAGNIFPLLGSELVLTSLDQITLQLSREGNLEAGLAKDMVMSCLLRVAGDMQSSEISTPFLQFSNEASAEQLTGKNEEKSQGQGTLK